MRLITVILYFVVAIIVFASLGVTIPYVLETLKDGKHSIEGLNQNIVTYYIALFASASLDLILKFTDKNKSYKKPLILTLIVLNILVFGGTGYILYNNSKGIYKEIPFSIILGAIVSFIVWWWAHYEDDSFNPTSSLGGNPNKSLSNG